ncbi:response regulator [Fulvivirga sp. RKSG066]|nr:response regulator [Fulvivirga aurantia]
MIVDDNEVDIFINKKVLEFSNFCSETICMTSATDALDYLQGDNILPEVIFLDLNMPVVDGFRFLFEYAKFPESIRQQISIVVLTSSDNNRDKEKIAANPDVLQFVSKPLNEFKLKKIKDDLFDEVAN